MSTYVKYTIRNAHIGICHAKSKLSGDQKVIIAMAPSSQGQNVDGTNLCREWMLCFV